MYELWLVFWCDIESVKIRIARTNKLDMLLNVTEKVQLSIYCTHIWPSKWARYMYLTVVMKISFKFNLGENLCLSSGGLQETCVIDGTSQSE